MNGQLTEGTQRIFFAELGDPNVEKFFEDTSRFMSGRFITMMFEPIGAESEPYVGKAFPNAVEKQFQDVPTVHDSCAGAKTS